MKTIILAVIIFSANLSFAGRINLSPGANKVEKKGVASVWGEWIKDKGNKFDVKLGIQNVGKEPIIVLLQDIGCSKGKAVGSIKHTFFNTGERTIDFHGGESKTFSFVCKLPTETMGNVSVTVRKVYANKSGDGKTTGKVIAENITWKPEELK